MRMVPKYKEGKDTLTLKIVVVGDTAVGKTDLTTQFTKGTFSTSYETIHGPDFADKSVNIDNKLVTLQIWDLRGAPTYKSLRQLFYKGALGVVYVFDVSRRETFKNLDKWRQEVKQEIGDVPSIIVGNKIDLPRKVESQEAEQYSKSVNSPYFETNAHNNTNVEESFEAIGRLILKNRENA
jgi:small GTP-binding protein